MFSSTHNRKDVFCFVFSPTGLRRSKLRPYTSRPPLPRLFALQQKATASATTKHCSAWPGCAGVLQDQRESTADHGCDICEQAAAPDRDRRQPSRSIRHARQWHANRPHPACFHEEPHRTASTTCSTPVQGLQYQRKRQLLTTSREAALKPAPCRLKLD